MTKMTHKQMLDYSTFFEDCDAKTLREYFQALLSTLWEEGGGFSGKRPFGNSCWEMDIYKALVEMQAIKGKLVVDYGYTCLGDFDRSAANKLVPKLIAEMCK